MRVETFSYPGELPPSLLGLCADLQAENLFFSATWMTEVAYAGLQPGDRLQLHVLLQDEAEGPRAVAVLPTVYSRLYGSHPGARVMHFLQREDQPYAPVGDGIDVAEVTTQVVRALAAMPKPVDVVRASPLDPASAFTGALADALKRNGHWVQMYRHARSHFAPVAGLTFAGYLAQRPRSLRETLDLNTRLLMNGGRGEFHYPCTPELLADAWDTFCMIVDKAPEEEVRDSLDYLRSATATAAAAGALRLGMFSLDGEPVAMQFWLLNGGIARCLRIWSAQGQRTFPIDDVLTQFMALCLIDGDHVDELEFGDVSEEFAGDWAPQFRLRVGLAAFNRRTWRGIRGAARHIGLGWIRSLPRRLLRGPLALR